MITRSCIVTVVLCAVVASASTAQGVSVPIWVAATANEFGGPEPDVFTLTYSCDCDIRILQVIYDLSFSAGQLYFNTAGTGGYDFEALPDAFWATPATTCSLGSHLSADGSQQLVVQFTDFQPSELLAFAIDVDGPLSTTWTPAQMAGAYMGIVFDPRPAFPGSLPVGVVYHFVDLDGQSVATAINNVQVPEPATLALVGLGSLAALAGRRRRRR